ncbi:MAG: hypothetical protein HUU46_23785 [Candidatus Hydrogenedentes bacterium]|nr:hypothetical protein [Candidatus Hydrogenedentota bacterium]
MRDKTWRTGTCETLLVVVSLFCMGCPTPGTESMDVRDVNDAAVAQN